MSMVNRGKHAKPAASSRKKVARGIGFALVGLVAIFFVASYAIDRYLLAQTFTRVPANRASAIATFDGYYAPALSRTPVEFVMDGKTLRGFVYEKGSVESGAPDSDAPAPASSVAVSDAPASPPADTPSTAPAKGLVVFRHGIFSQHQDYLLIIGALAERGWKVFAYDAIGCGLSDGDSTMGFPQSPRDVHRALQYVQESGLSAGLPVVLMGHSWGGYGVAAALNFHDDVKACVTMSGFADPTAITVESAKAGFGPLAATQAPTIWLANQLDFGADANLNAVDGINGANIPVLVVHGTGDTVVGYDTTGIIAQRDRITNPKVEYAVMDDPARNGHNTYFNAPDTQVYINELSTQLAKLQAQYGVDSASDLPDDAIAAFLASVDTKRANTPDPALIDLLDTFLTRAVQK